MAKTLKKHLKLTTLFCLHAIVSLSQSKSGIENYHQWGSDQSWYWMPVVHYKSEKNWYAELRYNYEEMNTLSLFTGKNFSVNRSFKFDLTPLLGVSLGSLRALSVGANTDIEYKNWYTSVQLQYSHDLEGLNRSFFFSWSEAGYNLFPNFFIGVAGQFTVDKTLSVCEPGLVGGLSLGRFTIPVYLFNPFKKNNSVILGLNYEWEAKKSKRVIDRKS